MKKGEQVAAARLIPLVAPRQVVEQGVSIENRREAIKTAVLLAQPGDIILIAGKGHENYQA